jgi:hypothetical protein
MSFMQAVGRSSLRLDYSRQAFREDMALALHLRAKEFTDMKFQSHGLTVPRKIG